MAVPNKTVRQKCDLRLRSGFIYVSVKILHFLKKITGHWVLQLPYKLVQVKGR